MQKGTGAILLGVMLIAGCAGLFFEEPVIILKEIHVRQLSLNDAALVFIAEIRNPNGYELRLQSLDYTVHLGGREAGSGSLDRGVTVPASSSATVEIPVTARFGRLGGVVRLYVTGRELPYRIEGKALVRAGLFDRTFPFSRSGTLSPKKTGS